MSNLQAQLNVVSAIEEAPVEVARDLANMEALKINTESQMTRPPVSAQAAREANRNLLNSLFKFRPGEPLGEYIASKTGLKKDLYSLAEVLTVLKEVIRRESMFDDFNPSIILCDSDLEVALGMKALHVTEIRDIVLKQLQKVSGPPSPPDTTSTTPATSQLTPYPSQSLGLSKSLSTPIATPVSLQKLNSSPVSASQPILPLSSNAPGSSFQPRTAQATMTARQLSCAPRPSIIGANVYNNPSARFSLKPDFVPVIKSVPGVDPKQTTFSYEQVTLLLSKYILARKRTLFDQRNIKVALVSNDPLGKAFNVKAFHRCQVTNLLRSQLIHVEESGNSSVSSTSVDPGSGSLCVGLNSEGVPCTVKVPPFPVLEKSQSLPAPRATLTPRNVTAESRLPSTSSGVVRKRSLSPDQEVKRSRDHAPTQYAVVVRKANDSDESETETICSAQGYETAAAETQVDEAIMVERVESTENGNDDGSNTSDTEMEDEKCENWRTAMVYSVEYDVESSSEDEKRPDIAGGGADTDSVNDTDIEDNYVVAAGAVAVMAEAVGSDSDYLGDSEQEDLQPGEKELDVVDPELEERDNWRCAQCDTPNTPLIRYCGKCWKIRKGWMPDRPKPKWKTRPISSRPRKEKAWGKTFPALDRSLSDPGHGQDEADCGLPPQVTVSDDEKSKVAVGTDTISSSQSTDSGISIAGSQESFSSGSSQELEVGFSQDLNSVSGSSGSNKCDDAMSVSSQDLGSEVSVPKEQNLCIFCCVRPKDASFIHGRLGHQVCCYQCAKKYWNKQVRCPVCRRKIERIVRNLFA